MGTWILAIGLGFGVVVGMRAVAAALASMRELPRSNDDCVWY